MGVAPARAQDIFQGLRDIYTPVSFPLNPWIIVFFGLLVVVLTAVAIRAFFQQKKKQNERLVEPPRPASVIAYEALEQLRKKKLIEAGNHKAFYSRLSDIVRRYLEAQFAIQAPEMTTEEFLYTLSRSPSLLAGHKTIFERFLRACDLVKFAKYGPSAQEMRESFDIAKTLVDQTKPQGSCEGYP